jgi:hypothetical protein
MEAVIVISVVVICIVLAVFLQPKRKTGSVVPPSQIRVPDPPVPGLYKFVPTEALKVSRFSDPSVACRLAADAINAPVVSEGWTYMGTIPLSYVENCPGKDKLHVMYVRVYWMPVQVQVNPETGILVVDVAVQDKDGVSMTIENLDEAENDE